MLAPMRSRWKKRRAPERIYRRSWNHLLVRHAGMAKDRVDHAIGPFLELRQHVIGEAELLQHVPVRIELSHEEWKILVQVVRVVILDDLLGSDQTVDRFVHLDALDRQPLLGWIRLGDMASVGGNP